ncbi:short-chain collagen C4-like [Mercenaria mercenaria]|uniref:short-chain collagen C4-like n=1 Tax=Mercenaria mercenaria TaxID=6596 RepID=UPI00234F8F2D|nr:short-chain collagen C4-like [Mercenaria mercenaria]
MAKFVLIFVLTCNLFKDFVICDKNTGDEYQSMKDEIEFLRERLETMDGKFVQLQKDFKRECRSREERFVGDGELNVEQQVIKLRQDVNQIKQGIASSYVRWGRTVCSGNASLVYKGYMGGNAYTDKGGPANYVCLPEDPIWGKYQDGIQNHGNKIYGTEYELYGSFNPFDKNLHDEDAPCAVCRTYYATTIMIPARTDCYSGWNKEYSGYLMSIDTVHPAAGEYICIDSDPEYILHGSGNQNGNVLYVVEAVCGSLPCLPYVDGRELTCVVCSK